MSDMTSILGNALMEDGYSFLAAADLRRLLPAPALADWAGFRASWDQLVLDTHMADGGRYRRRRFAAFSVCSRGLRRKPHQPHFQSRDHNPLNGGVERWFEPIDNLIAGHSVTEAILKFGFALFDPLTPAGTRPDAWHVELHQFRIEPEAGVSAPPTPEGIHRDGVDWVMVTMVGRENVSDGVTSIRSPSGRHLADFTLQSPLDTALIDDASVLHGVAPVQRVDPNRPAFRDVLVVTLSRV